MIDSTINPQRQIIVTPLDPALTAIMRRLTPAEKITMVCEIGDLARFTVAAELHRQHPDCADYRIEAGVLLVFLTRTPELEALGDAVTAWHHRRLVELGRPPSGELPSIDLCRLQAAIQAALSSQAS